jgi:SAM-dependent methyltransferase
MTCPLCGAASIETVLGRTPAFRCPECTLLSLGDVPVPEGYYEDYFDRFRSERSAPSAVLRDRQYVIDAAHLKSYQPAGRVLDVGCSAGGFLAEVEKAGDGYAQLVGIDPDRSAIDRCRALDLRTPHTFAVGDLLDAPLPVGHFDAIVFRGTLQYVGPTLQAVLDRVDGLLAPDGYVFIYALPNADSFLFHVLADRWHLFHPLEHRLMFGDAAMRALAGRMGWEVVELSYPYLDTPYASPASDYARVMEMARGGQAGPVPFWGNLMQVVLRSTGAVAGARERGVA